MPDPEILISLYFHDPESMTQEDLDQLSDWIKQDSSHAKRFAHAAFVHRALYDCLTGEEIQGAMSSRPAPGTPDDSGVIWDDSFWHRIAEYENKAPALSVERPAPDEKRLQEGESRKGAKKPSRIVLSAGILCLTVLLLLMVAVRIGRDGSGNEVATLKSSMHATFAGRESLASGTRLDRRKEPLRLQQGMVDIMFDNGAEVLIEGPGEFRLRSAAAWSCIQVDCLQGYPNVPEGFRVDTPSSTASWTWEPSSASGLAADRTSEMHMFKGKASLIPGGEGRVGQGQILTEGQARRVGTAGTVKDIQMDDARPLCGGSSRNRALPGEVSQSIWRTSSAEAMALVRAAGPVDLTSAPGRRVPGHRQRGTDRTLPSHGQSIPPCLSSAVCRWRVLTGWRDGQGPGEFQGTRLGRTAPRPAGGSLKTSSTGTTSRSRGTVTTGPGRAGLRHTRNTLPSPCTATPASPLIWMPCVRTCRACGSLDSGRCAASQRRQGPMLERSRR